MSDVIEGEIGGELPVAGAGLRIARTCPKDDCNWRAFGDPEAVCPQHGSGVDQGNATYMGKQTAHLVRPEKKARAKPKGKAAKKGGDGG